MNKEYWEKFYEGKKTQRESSFARFIAPWINDKVIDLGCGDGRDVFYFKSLGYFADGVDQITTGTTIDEYMKIKKAPKFVYTRFFWHAISRKQQLKILKWAKKFLFIEARTTEDKGTKKIFGNHKRNYVDVKLLVKDLKNHGYQIRWLAEGRGYAPYKKEDPHVVRVIAIKQ